MRRTKKNQPQVNTDDTDWLFGQLHGAARAEEQAKVVLSHIMRGETRAHQLWKCEQCAPLGITNSPLARRKNSSYTVVANSRIDRFRNWIDETNRVSRPHHSGAAMCRARG
jgi:hypothetical protein